MRVNTKGGVPPCDRRLDRRKVAIAAAAALFLFATVPAKAGVVDFEIIQVDGGGLPVSFQSFVQTIDLTAIASGVHTTVAQFPDPDGAGPLTGSDVTTVYGNILADLQPGTIEMTPGGNHHWAINNTPGVGGVPGLFSPFDPVTSDPGFPPGGVNPISNLGVSATTGVSAGLALFAVFHDVSADWFTTPSPGPPDAVGAVGGKSGPRALTPVTGVFSYVPGADFFLGASGRLAFTSLLGASTGDIVGDPTSVFGSAGLAKPSWDPLATLGGLAPLGTLTLPVESSFSTPLDLSSIVPGAVGTITFSSFGVIVATPKIPEPSSIVLLGFGVIGLLAYGLRLRRRKV